MDFGNVIDSIWNLAENLIKAIGAVWNWLTTPLEFSVLGFSVELGYSPIGLLGVGVLVLVSLWVVKDLIPGG